MDSLMSDGLPRLVIVDDDETILRSLRVALRTKYVVICYNDPIRAIEALSNECPDVVLLDVMMPEHDGFWVYREIRKFNSEVPIIFNSAYQAAMGVKDTIEALKPFGYLAKNGKLTDLLDLLAKAVQKVPKRGAL
jgi:DNA-binding response OmpR family regulator